MCYPGHKLLDLDSKPCKSTKLLNAFCLLILNLDNMNPLPCHGCCSVIVSSKILNEASVLISNEVIPTPNFLPSQPAAITVSEYVIFVKAGPDM